MSEDEWRPALEVPGSKLVHHLLNVDHPKGGPKARFFLAFGFDPGQPEIMAEALIMQATDARCILRSVELGPCRRMIVEGPMETPDGRRPRVRSVWQLQDGLMWRLLTAVPLT
ncbi:hypothetical protein VQ03_23430 [Methylobacterium tarhaniae]|uniref:DUF6883 domain-containing protein n=1 Tax=Methylobacterium tarhaniae TaxID=1187852 RepID=A0A0J6SLX7_9HYPH|nr:DUF6883 domain-containing protein [Methylobacterium tarhaniae]KMO34413.1 hypothetical protein VQ03_23430 [Methylobacterium tarhaniae]